MMNTSINNSTNRSVNKGAEAATSAILNLKPLKELAQYFDIDIASCLQDYLEELEDQGHSVSTINEHLPQQVLQQHQKSTNNANDSTNSSMNQSQSSSGTTNFTHAALLLQNSSSVYSRKVEYLYRLVYQSLDKLIQDSALHNGKSKRGGAGGSAGGGENGSSSSKKRKSRDKDISAFEEFDPEMEFLLLDDVLPIDEDGGKITLPNVQEVNKINPADAVGGGTLTPWTIHRGTRTRSRSNTMSDYLGGGGGGSIGRLSIGSVSRLDSTMMTISTRGSRGGSKMAASNMAQTMVQRLLSDGTEPATSGEGGSLRLVNGTCDICANGALLIPGTSLNPLSENENVNDGGGNVAPSQLDLSLEGESITGNNEVLMPMEEEEDCGDYDTYDDGPGFELPQDNHEDGAVPTNLTSHISTLAQEGVQLSLEQIAPVSPKPVKEKPDPWSLLDPQDVTASKSRALRIRTTYRLPEGCDEPPSSAVTGSRTRKIHKIRRRNKNKSSSNDKCNEFVHTSSQSLKAMKLRIEKRLSLSNDNRSEMDVAEDKESESVDDLIMTLCPSSDFVFGDEFIYIAKAQSKRRSNEKRRIRKEEAARRAESTTAAIVNEQFRDVYEAGGDDENYDGYGEDYDLGGEDDYDAGENDQVDNANACLNDFDEIIASAEDGNNGDMNRKLTFDALCRAHLKEFAKGAEKYAVESKLSKRVGLWQDKVAQVLENEEERPEFDIQHYSRKVISNIQQGAKLDKADKISMGSSIANDTIPFVSITKDKEPYEVSRTFLTALMLCNDEKISFGKNDACNEGRRVHSPHTLTIKLLNSDLDSPMDTYLAPSIQEQQEAMMMT